MSPPSQRTLRRERRKQALVAADRAATREDARAPDLTTRKRQSMETRRVNQQKRRRIARTHEIGPSHPMRSPPTARYSDTDVRSEALRNVFQFRAAPTDASSYSKAVVSAMNVVQEQVRADIETHIGYLAQISYFVCPSCGHQARTEQGRTPTPRQKVKFLKILQHHLYASNAESFTICASCTSTLTASRLPSSALTRGWVFNNPIPDCLAALSVHDAMLIPLRLPCVYSWRCQGGYGQFATKGSPVSFSNPVAELVTSLPRHPAVVFAVMLENGQLVNVNADRVLHALIWLKENNYLYADVDIDETALTEIASFQTATYPGMQPGAPTESEAAQAEAMEATLGAQGPLDGEGLHYLAKARAVGVEELDNSANARTLIKHMLRPFTHRRSHMLPAYDAVNNLETYFPILFPFGRGGPSTTNLVLAVWIKNALAVYQSRFAYDVNFIFFVHAVQRRRRLTGLATNARLRDACTNALIDIRELLSANAHCDVVAQRIDKLLRSGTLSASFETLRGSPAFWADLKRTSWAYLTHFGPCQLFLTMSVADLHDPFVYMQVDPSLTLEDARQLSSSKRAECLANNPVQATTVFHRRVQSLFDNFLFGQTSPFGDIKAFLGRVEQQARHSPHLHLLIWLERKSPPLSGYAELDGRAISNFVELFCSAILPHDSLLSQAELEPPNQQIPLPIHKPKVLPGHIRQPLRRGTEKHRIISAPINPGSFNGTLASNTEMRNLLNVCQTHVCQQYCLGKANVCRFLFPFEVQARGSLAARSSAPSDSRLVALAPRSSPDLNSTHPLLTAMYHSNTDVTVVTGNSVAESAYVCNYACKADKTPLFDRAALKRLQSLGDGISNDRKLLSSIARNSTSVRTVGGQEAVDNLLGNPLTFLSAEVTMVYQTFLLHWPGALSPEQQSMQDKPTTSGDNCQSSGTDLLPTLDEDSIVSSKSKYSRRFLRGSACQTDSNPWIHDIFKKYMRRPACLQDLTASTFHSMYAVMKLAKNRVHFDREMLLQQELGGAAGPRFLVVKRKISPARPQERHILTIPSRGEANDESPAFAAAALLLHVPFRNISDLLCGKTLTCRLQDMLDDSLEFPDLKLYVKRSHELADGLSTTFPVPERHNTAKYSNASSDEEGGIEIDDIDSNMDVDSDELPINPFIDLPTSLREQGNLDPFKVQKKWISCFALPHNSQPQMPLFKQYLKNCQTLGLVRANQMLSSTENGSVMQLTADPNDVDIYGPGSVPDPSEMLNIKKHILEKCKNQEQKEWLIAVTSYLQLYYSKDVSSVPYSIDVQFGKNHPLFTNAPGGVGKSWLIEQVSEFVGRCIPPHAQPNWQSMSRFDSGDVAPELSDFSLVTELPPGRLGRVAIFATSGVAAGNSNGFTFHNGLRCHSITTFDVLNGPSEQTRAKLLKDFAMVSCIVIDEFSMASLTLLAYLDRVARSVRPAFSYIPYGGIPVLITGDAFQLPVINDYGILSREDTIPNHLKSIYEHFNERVYWLALTKSIRQNGDDMYAKILGRMRIAQSDQSDVDVLNQRFFADLSDLEKSSLQWNTAPVITATNKNVRAFNNAAIHRNGEKLGTFKLYNMPTLTKAVKEDVRRRKAKQIFGIQGGSRARNEMFNPDPAMVLYPGMPLMLRKNICPALGLSNGSIGTLISLNYCNELPAHESLDSAIDRAVLSSRGTAQVPSLLIRFASCYKGMVGALASGTELQEHAKGNKTVLIEPQLFKRMRALPVSPAHSLTMHKCQGLTLPFIIIDPRNTFSAGALYVAFSRAPGLTRIALATRVSVELLNKFKQATCRLQSKLAAMQHASTSLTPILSYLNTIEVSLLLRINPHVEQ